MAESAPSGPVSVNDFARWKAKRRPISVLTVYDFPMASLFDEAGVDCLLVGDTLGMVVQGHETTLPVTLDQILYHTEIVARAARRAFVVADLPFMSYQVSPEQAIASAGRVLKETRARAVKVEGGASLAPTIRKLVDCGIPVMGHVGLRPQAVHQYGGYKVQRDLQTTLTDARAVADAGAFSVVLECVAAEVAAQVTAALPIPTIGIGSGSECDGQVLVAHDVLGLFQSFQPKFARRYAEVGNAMRDAARAYVSDVQQRRFPSSDESFS
jgi:3-methyl-2-oxobutanoate hydroxymethyltransferase